MESSTQSMTQAPALGLTHSRAHSGMPPIVIGTCPPRISALPPSRPLTQYLPAKQFPTAPDFPSSVLQHEGSKHIHPWGQAVEQEWLFLEMWIKLGHAGRSVHTCVQTPLQSRTRPDGEWRRAGVYRAVPLSQHCVVHTSPRILNSKLVF